MQSVAGAAIEEWGSQGLIQLFVDLARGLSEFFKLGGSELRFPEETVAEGEEPPSFHETERLRELRRTVREIFRRLLSQEEAFDTRKTHAMTRPGPITAQDAVCTDLPDTLPYLTPS